MSDPRPMNDPRIVRLDETERVSFGPLSHYQLIIGGSLVTESQALDKLRSAQMQWSARNGGGTGWSTG